MQVIDESDEGSILKGEVRQTLALVGAVTLLAVTGVVMRLVA